MNPSFPFLEQLNRLESANRELQNYQEITDENFSSAIKSSEYFFFIAGHMKDWVKASGVPLNTINDFIQENYELGIVRNVSLRLKHYEVKSPSKNEVADFGPGLKIPIGRTWDGFEQKAILMIPVDGKVLRILPLANNVILLWTKFLTKQFPILNERKQNSRGNKKIRKSSGKVATNKSKTRTDN